MEMVLVYGIGVVVIRLFVVFGCAYMMRACEYCKLQWTMRRVKKCCMEEESIRLA